MRKLIFILFSFFSIGLYSQGLVINEMSSKNEDAFLSIDSESPDWIELYNSSLDTLTLLNYFLSDNSEELLQWALPNIRLAPQSYLLIFASGDDYIDGNQIHTNFKIKSQGEELYLSNINKEIIDQFPVVPLSENECFGRYPDGGVNCGILYSATPGQANQVIAREFSDIVFSKEAGVYTDAFQLGISASNLNTEIYYTVDGSDPDTSSLLYTDSIIIDSRSNIENDISEIPTADNWVAPKGNVFKGIVIKTAAYLDGEMISDIFTKSYFVYHQNKRKYSIPIIALSLEPKDLFSAEYGIYVKGNNTNFSQKGREWERIAHFEFFDSLGVLQYEQKAGVRAYGNKGRTFAQKSLLLYARESYGSNKFRHAFFDNTKNNSFKRVVLRSASSNDWKNTMFKNELAQEVSQNLNFDHPKSNLVIVFINGEYWGLHHLSERTDEFYIEDYHNVDKDNIDFLSSNSIVEKGSANDFITLKDFITLNDLSLESNYEYVSKQIDITNFIDYNCAEIFFSNTDWPNNNIKFWKKHNDGKWQWLFFDCDECMSYEYYDLLGDFLHNEKYRLDFPLWSTFMLHNLLKNEAFKTTFRKRFENLLDNDFSSKNIMNQISNMKKIYSPEISEHCLRWGGIQTFSDWQEAVDGLNSFASFRPQIMRKQLKEYFQNPFLLFPNPTKNKLNLVLRVDKDSFRKMSVTNSTGQLVYSISESYNNPIKLPELRAGIYFVEVTLQDNTYFQKLVIE